ncbi:MAG: hypothetical protein EHM55_03265 [Acidobacteria bacterium]|nr:MAG: hypothetical protein EHM55_03265 [Acidobacteriota bacterium]
MTVALTIFCFAAAARLTYLVSFPSSIDSVYWSLADALVRTGSMALDGVPITDFGPGYPVFLAGVRMLAGDRAGIAQIVQILVASLGAVFLHRLALHLSGSRRAALISAALFAVHPLLVRQAAAASDLSLATTLLVAFAYAFVLIRGPRSAILAGTVLGLAILTRSMVLPVLVCGAVILLAQRKPALALAFVAPAVILVALFVLRNHSANGSWWPTRSGINLYIGNSPYTRSLLPRHDLDLLEVVAHTMVERERPDLRLDAPRYATEIDAFLSRRAVAYMMERPLRTLGEKAVNAVYLLSPYLVPFNIATPDTRLVIHAGNEVAVEHAASRPLIEVIAHAVASTVILPAGIAGIYRRRRVLAHDAILWAVAATFIVVNAVYVPASRYAAPMLFVLCFYAGVALAAFAPPVEDAHDGHFAS